MFVPLSLTALAGYLLGALPFGFLVARAHGVNIFEVGSRNPGATNVRRVLGAKAGNTVFALDALKGALAASPVILSGFAIEWTVAGMVLRGERWLQLGVVGLVAALVGHSFSCFTRFRGGKGVATASGGFLVLLPLATLGAAAVWTVTFFTSRYVSLASILAALTLPLAAWLLDRPPLIQGIAAVVALFVIIRHRTNIGRLLNGTEARFARKKPAPTSS